MRQEPLYEPGCRHEGCENDFKAGLAGGIVLCFIFYLPEKLGQTQTP